MKEVNARNLYTLELRNGRGSDMLVFVMVRLGFHQRDRLNYQTENNGTLYRQPVYCAQ